LSNKINWTLLENDTNRDLFELYKTLIGLRTKHPAFRSSSIDFFHEENDLGVLAFHRFNNDGDVVVVVLNLSDNDLDSYEIANFPINGHVKEWTTGTETDLGDNHFIANLPRRSGLVLTKA
jgi:1,4-alpha-glucan branching enzyme